MSSATEGSQPGVTRRQALKRGAAVTAAVAWTVPTIQAVSLTAAHADSASAPPNNPPPNNPPPSNPNNPPASPPVTPPTKGSTPPGHSGGGSAPAGEVSGSGGTKSGGQLAFTGTTLPLVPTVAVAAGMIATGIAAQAARSRPADAVAADLPADDTEN